MPEPNEYLKITDLNRQTCFYVLIINDIFMYLLLTFFKRGEGGKGRV